MMSYLTILFVSGSEWVSILCIKDEQLSLKLQKRDFPCPTVNALLSASPILAISTNSLVISELEARNVSKVEITIDDSWLPSLSWDSEELKMMVFNILTDLFERS